MNGRTVRANGFRSGFKVNYRLTHTCHAIKTFFRIMLDILRCLCPTWYRPLHRIITMTYDATSRCETCRKKACGERVKLWLKKTCVLWSIFKLITVCNCVELLQNISCTFRWKTFWNVWNCKLPLEAIAYKNVRNISWHGKDTFQYKNTYVLHSSQSEATKAYLFCFFEHHRHMQLISAFVRIRPCFRFTHCRSVEKVEWWFYEYCCRVPTWQRKIHHASKRFNYCENSLLRIAKT